MKLKNKINQENDKKKNQHLKEQGINIIFEKIIKLKNNNFIN